MSPLQIIIYLPQILFYVIWNDFCCFMISFQQIHIFFFKCTPTYSVALTSLPKVVTAIKQIYDSLIQIFFLESFCQIFLFILKTLYKDLFDFLKIESYILTYHLFCCLYSNFILCNLFSYLIALGETSKILSSDTGDI